MQHQADEEQQVDDVQVAVVRRPVQAGPVHEPQFSFGSNAARVAWQTVANSVWLRGSCEHSQMLMCNEAKA